MRVLMVSKACIVGIYQRKLEAIAERGIELLVVVPPSWKDERGEQTLERVYTRGYNLQTTPIALNGNFHLHFFPGIGRYFRSFRPQIVHIDEEPYNLAAWQSLFHAQRAGAKSLFFTWQNIKRDYPLPFAWGERHVLQSVDYALAGTESARDVWRAKGYGGPLAVMPQFGVDADLFYPQVQRPERPFTIGYVGRLVPEKGIDGLVRAAARLDGDWCVRIVGGGPQRQTLEKLAQELGIAGRVEFIAQQPSTGMPEQMRALDVLVLPSLTRPNWKEQFGRVLVEAMASRVPVIGSDSGAIPGVIGDGGVVVPEGDEAALLEALIRLRADDALYQQLAQKGRERVLAHFTHESIAAATVAVYREMYEQMS